MMVAFNFQSNFSAPIESQQKIQTVRSKQRAFAGDVLQLYTGQRTKLCRRLLPGKTVVCAVSDYCHLAPGEITFGDKSLHPENLDDFARMDGFCDYNEMMAWFQERYNQRHFVGWVHRWRIEP